MLIIAKKQWTQRNTCNAEPKLKQECSRFKGWATGKFRDGLSNSATSSLKTKRTGSAAQSEKAQLPHTGHTLSPTTVKVSE